MIQNYTISALWRVEWQVCCKLFNHFQSSTLPAVMNGQHFGLKDIGQNILYIPCSRTILLLGTLRKYSKWKVDSDWWKTIKDGSKFNISCHLPDSIQLVTGVFMQSRRRHTTWRWLTLHGCLPILNRLSEQSQDVVYSHSEKVYTSHRLSFLSQNFRIQWKWNR